MPWHTSDKFAFSPLNKTSRKPYRGINTLCLWSAAQAKGYNSAEWATYQQWQDKSGQVRKGEKSTTVVFWKLLTTRKKVRTVKRCPALGAFRRSEHVALDTEDCSFASQPETKGSRWRAIPQSLARSRPTGCGLTFRTRYRSGDRGAAPRHRRRYRHDAGGIGSSLWFRRGRSGR